MNPAPYLVTAEERSQIEQALAAYCRGLDRFDREIALSAFHPEAVLDYSGLYRGDAPGFVDWVWPLHKKFELNVHRVANVFIDRNPSGDLVSESYVTSLLRRRDGGGYVDRVGHGRYIDRWVDTDGHRLVIIERDYLNDLITERQNPPVTAQVVAPVDGAAVLQPSRDRRDPSYRLFAATDIRRPASPSGDE